MAHNNVADRKRGIASTASAVDTKTIADAIETKTADVAVETEVLAASETPAESPAEQPVEPVTPVEPEAATEPETPVAETTVEPEAPAETPAEAPVEPVETPAPADEAPPVEKAPVLVENMDELLATSTAKGGGGSKIRPDVAYVLITENVKNLRSAKIPLQCQVMLKLLNGALASKAAIKINGQPAISEPDLHALVVEAERNAILKTKQDPWHIFRYYRVLMTKAVSLGGLAVLKTVTIPTGKAS